MKQFKKATLLMVVIFSLVFLNLSAGEKKVVDKTFKAKGLVEITLVSGDCLVKKGKSGEIKVHVEYTFPAEKYKPVFKEEGDKLVLKEEFTKQKKGMNGVKGESSWTVTVPENTNINATAASGDLTLSELKSTVNSKVASGDVNIKDFNGTLNLKAASGDVKLNNVGGKINAGAASGDIKMHDVKGALEVQAASGDIRVTGVVFTGAGSFKAASGDIKVTLAKSSNFDLELNAVSGDVTLDYNGNAVKGYFVFHGQKDDISSDIPFDNKEKSGYSPFVKRYFKKGGDSPKVTLKTVSGDLRFKK